MEEVQKPLKPVNANELRTAAMIYPEIRPLVDSIRAELQFRQEQLGQARTLCKSAINEIRMGDIAAAIILLSNISKLLDT